MMPTVFAYLRKNGRREVLVVLNLSDHSPVQFSFNDSRVEGEFRNIFSNVMAGFTNNKNMEMQEWGYLVYEK
jgi:hypothetical protein